MLELLILLGIGVVAGVAMDGGSGSGSDLPEEELLTDGDDGVISEDYRQALNATYDSLVDEGEISRTEADALLSQIDFRSGAISVNGGGGNDEIVGSQQADTISGGAGDDLVFGGAENDQIDLGDGSDVYGVDPRAAVRPDDLEPFPVQTAPLATEAELEGGNDRILGGAGVDFIADGFGADHLNGQAGDDLLISVDQDGGAADRVIGGGGADVIIVDEGDTVVGGAGEDRITIDVFAGVSDGYQVVTIEDFEPSQDVVEIEGGRVLLPVDVFDPITGQQVGERESISVVDLDDGSGAIIFVRDIPVVRVLGGQGMTVNDVLIST